VPRLYGRIRPGADFERSLRLLRSVKPLSAGTLTKSGMMLGLGETFEEVEAVFQRLSGNSCDMLTLGQYLRPTLESEPVHEYITPSQFDAYREAALKAGIRSVQAGPRIRSSYRAGRAVA
jgi:lipoyl synthase